MLKKSELKDRWGTTRGKSCKLGDFFGDEMQELNDKMQFFSKNALKRAQNHKNQLTHFGG